MAPALGPESTEEPFDVMIRKRLAIGFAAAAILVLSAQPVLAAPALPTASSNSGGHGGIEGQGATFPALLYKAWEAVFSEQHPTTFDPSGNSANGFVMSYNAIGSGAGIKEFYNAKDARTATEMFGASDALLANSDKSSITSTVGSVPHAPDGARPGSSGVQPARPEAAHLDHQHEHPLGHAVPRWADPGQDLRRPDHQVERQGDQGPQPADRQPAEPDDHAGLSLRRVGHDVHLHLVPQQGQLHLGVGPGRHAPSKTLADKISALNSKRTAVGANGNEGVAATVLGQVGAIGYVEIAYANQLGLKYAWMRTGDTTHKYFVPPSTYGAQVAAAVAAAAGTANDPVNPGTIESGAFYQPVNQKGATAYPISGYTWVLLYADLQWARTIRDCGRRGQPRVLGLGGQPHRRPGAHDRARLRCPSALGPAGGSPAAPDHHVQPHANLERELTPGATNRDLRRPTPRGRRRSFRPPA